MVMFTCNKEGFVWGDARRESAQGKTGWELQEAAGACRASSISQNQAEYQNAGKSSQSPNKLP
jgi:hypothetical protein